MSLILIPLIGVLGGLVSGLFGLGGGVIFVPLLVILCHYNIHLAIGTSLAAIIPTAFIAALRHGMAEMIDWKTVILIAVFAMIGAWFGARLSLKIDVLLLKRLYACLLLILCVKLFFQN